MIAVELLLWLALAAIVYTYALYPLVLVLLTTLWQLRSDWRFLSGGSSRRAAAAESLPTVAVLVAAYNEERHVAERIRNLLASDYPPERLRIYVGSDGSSDGTAREAAPLVGPRVFWHGFAQRRGKPSVLNDLAALTTEEILVFTDANTSFAPQTVRQLVRHFDDPRIGCVCGELRLVAADGSENQDHIYWRYERLLKFLESRLGGLLGANGGVYGLRREHFRAVPANTIVDDFWISMVLVQNGLRCHYDPEAVAYEAVPARISDEFRRRVRIGIGNYQAFVRFARLLDPRRGIVALTFFSHKVLRWLVPHCMLAALLANAVLAAQPFYAALLALQLAFYLVAGLGWWLGRERATPRPLRIPVFFVGMNLALLVGCWKYLTGQFTGAWARTER